MIRHTILISSLLATLSHLTAAQQQVTLIPANLPACAQACTNFKAAETGCVPPQAPVTSEAIYQSCFCQSALLTGFGTETTNTVCPGVCPEYDFTTIQKWYTSFCAPGAPVPSAPAPVPTTLATATKSAAAAATSTSGPNAAPNLSGTQDGQSWLATHWNWVIMLVVVAVGLAAIAILAKVLHARHRRRREAAENLGPRPDLQQWGPNQHSAHDLGGAEAYGTRAEKGKAPASNNFTGVARPGSKKIKKGIFGGRKSGEMI